MHPTALKNAAEFFQCYGGELPERHARVVDIGAQDVNGSLRQVCPPGVQYVGVDFIAGKGVDVVLADPYVLPLESESVDIVLSSSCFEHSEMFWLMFLEVMRILKPAGLFYMNVPANGDYHRWPADCWRFYPDSGKALVAWARRNGINAALLESYTSMQLGDQWNDFVAVYLKDEMHLEKWPARILDKKQDFMNGWRHGHGEVIKYSLMSEDKKKMAAVLQIITSRITLS